MHTEIPSHRSAIRRLHIESYPTAAEAALVDQLRADGKVALSLVEVEDGEVVGHLLLWPLEAPFAALGLAPLAVAQRRRNGGVAGRLVEEAIRWAQAEGWSAIFVLGDPSFYERFGFSRRDAEGFDSRHGGPHFMVLPLSSGGLPTTWGRIDFPAAFDALK